MDRIRPRAAVALQSLAFLQTPFGRAVRTRLAMDSVIVIGAVFVAFRLLNIFPWNVPQLDLHAYWESRYVIDYPSYSPFLIGAFLYSPAFARVIEPLTSMSWPAFAGLWTAMIVAAYVWMAGRWALPLLLILVVPLEIYLGQIDIFIAAAIVIGFRYPAAWALPLLTKLAPGIGLLWFAFRREWRSLLIALAATFGIAAISAVLAPSLWKGWIDLLLRSASDHQQVSGAYLAIPIWLRLPISVGLLWWGARTDRYWVVPVAAFLAMPILWANVFTILIGALPLLPLAGYSPARVWLLKTRTVTARRRAVAPSGAQWPAT